MDKKLSFDVHIQKIGKYKKIIGIVKWLSIIFPRNTLLTMQILYMRNLIINCFGKILKLSNIKDILLLDERFKEHLKKIFLKDLG